jgi:hypothetical protein
MTQPVRAPEHEPPRRPPLRAVPPPRRPDPAVIRRRRLVALIGLALLVALPIAVFTLLGGGQSDGKRISALLTTGASEPATLCDHLSTPMLEAVGGRDACLAASPERGPAGSVRDVSVNGDTAAAVVVRETGSEHVRLVRQDGDWKVDDVR